MAYLRPLGARLCSAAAASSTPFMVSPRPLMQRALELLLLPPKHRASPPSSPPSTLLDIGCGEGQVLAAAAELCAARPGVGAPRLRGIDYSEALCAATRARLEASPAARGLDVGVHCLSFSEREHAKSIAELVAEANRIYLFLDLGGVEAVAPLLREHAVPGTRVVSIDFPLPLPEVGGGLKKTYVQAFDAMDVFVYEK